MTTRIIKTIDMQMVKEYLQENLKIKVEFHKAKVYYDTTTLTVTLEIEGEEISKSVEYIYDL